MRKLLLGLTLILLNSPVWAQTADPNRDSVDPDTTAEGRSPDCDQPNGSCKNNQNQRRLTDPPEEVVGKNINKALGPNGPSSPAGKKPGEAE